MNRPLRPREKKLYKLKLFWCHLRQEANHDLLGCNTSLQEYPTSKKHFFLKNASRSSSEGTFTHRAGRKRVWLKRYFCFEFCSWYWTEQIYVVVCLVCNLKNTKQDDLAAGETTRSTDICSCHSKSAVKQLETETISEGLRCIKTTYKIISEFECQGRET